MNKYINSFYIEFLELFVIIKEFKVIVKSIVEFYYNFDVSEYLKFNYFNELEFKLVIKNVEEFIEK